MLIQVRREEETRGGRVWEGRGDARMPRTCGRSRRRNDALVEVSTNTGNVVPQRKRKKTSRQMPSVLYHERPSEYDCRNASMPADCCCSWRSPHTIDRWASILCDRWPRVYVWRFIYIVLCGQVVWTPFCFHPRLCVALPSTSSSCV